MLFFAWLNKIERIGELETNACQAATARFIQKVVSFELPVNIRAEEKLV